MTVAMAGRCCANKRIANRGSINEAKLIGNQNMPDNRSNSCHRKK
jgi:hypothetical protein